MKMREEKDVLGTINVPADRLWGAQTQRCLNHFEIGTEPIPFPLIKALATIKKAAAQTNCELGLISKDIATAIEGAAKQVMDGDFTDEFPISPWQTGSGTQSNMNANEVIANVSNRNLGHPIGMKHPVHPNDHVNLSQSSNDTFPTAMHIAYATEVVQKLQPALHSLGQELRKKQKQYEKVIKIGRTHLQDATPMYVAQELGAWATQIEMSKKKIEQGLKDVFQLAQGGTAVGTGLNSPIGFDTLVCQYIAESTGLPFCVSQDKFSSLAAHDALVGASGNLNQLATVLLKITNDIKILASGPRAGLAEIIIPANEPGSSIMPGKINPTQAEAMAMVACQVMGNHYTTSIAASQGQLQLNVFKPVIILNLLNSVRLLVDALNSFTLHCVQGLEYNVERLKLLEDISLMMVTALAPVIGYDKSAEIARKAHDDKTSLKESALALNYISSEDFDFHVRADKMVSAFALKDE